MAKSSWSRDELLIAFNLYCRIPFGKLHRSNPEIVSAAKKLNRTPSALAMKLVNFASFDPIHKKRNVKGLGHASQSDRQIWDEFNQNWEQLAFESQQTLVRILQLEAKIPISELDLVIPNGPTEDRRITRVRLVQGFFRDSVLSSYKYTCSFCGLSIVEMLCASHIIPWSKNIERRADPSNGLSLCSFHDRAFDRGLITIDEKLHIVISKSLQIKKTVPMHEVALLNIHGEKMILPQRFCPDMQALEYHRQNIFKSS
jgi:predicted restriction endonuclease